MSDSWMAFLVGFLGAYVLFEMIDILEDWFNDV